MKTLTSNAQAKVAQTTGTEPVILLEVYWATGKRVYSTHSIYGYQSKILKIGTLTSTINVSGQQSSDVNIALDDIDGELKTLIDTLDIHKTKAIVKMGYTDLLESDAFIIFQGQISAPFTWGENDRSVSFDILSEIESFEIGFSPEEGQLDFVSLEMIGVPWPLSFGSVLYSQTSKVHQTLTGTLLEDIGIIDPMIDLQITSLISQYSDQAVILSYYQMMMQNANLIGKPAQQLLTYYINLINQQHLKLKDITDTYDALEKAKIAEKRKPSDEAKKTERVELEDKLKTKANDVSVLQSTKAQAEANVDLTLYEYEVKKKAAMGQIEAYNALCNIMQQVLALQQEKCRQGKLVKTSFQIQDGDLFPQGVSTEITVNGVKYRGEFAGNVFTVDVGPYAKYKNIRVAPWHTDTDPCEPQDENNGLATFYLKNTPPASLSGLYLLVEAKDGSRHVIKASRQEGQKVIFDLINQNTPTGNPSGLDLNKILGKVQDLFQFNPAGDLLSPTGKVTPNLNVDPELYQRPEVQQLLQIIGEILRFSVNNNLSIKPELTNKDRDDLMEQMFGPDWKKRFNSLSKITPNQLEQWFKQYYGITQREIEFLSKLVFVLPMDNLGDTIIYDVPDARRVFTIVGEDINKIVEASGIPLFEWFNDNYIRPEEWPTDMNWRAEAGTVIRADDDDCQIHIANIVPSTVNGVHAYRRTKQGLRILAPVPEDYYTVQNANLGTIDVTAIVFPKALKEIEGENWEDEIFVTQTSSIGPHVCDVLDHLITTYIPGATTDFDDVRDLLDNYPVGYTITDRPNVLDEIARIAWESRCALVRDGLVFRLIYLSLEPDSVATLGYNDIITETFSISTTPSENLATRYIATYSKDYLPLLPNKHLPRKVLRNNLKKYGLISRDEYFHCYNVDSLVEKSAKFWLIRESNTWKHVSFKTTLKHIALDIQDCILFEDVLDVKGIITEINIDFENKELNISAWLPVRAGETEPYTFAWPSTVTTPFPLPIEEQEGLAGGYGPGTGVTGTIPGC